MNIKQFLRGFIIALSFFTRLPLPPLQAVSAAEFYRSQNYYPLVGLVIGGILWLLYALVHPVFPPLIVGALLLVAELLLTGGLHLDGFMDSMDGLLSAQPRERTLEIMKDSHVGAHAVISLAGLLILKFSLLASLTPQHSEILILMPVVSRWFVLFAILYFPYARDKGLGKGFHETPPKTSFVFSGAGVLLLTAYLLQLAGLMVVLFTGVVLGLWLYHVAKRLEGLTGDLYGATIEICEVLFLLMAFIPAYQL